MEFYNFHKKNGKTLRDLATIRLANYLYKRNNWSYFGPEIELPSAPIKYTDKDAVAKAQEILAQGICENYLDTRRLNLSSNPHQSFCREFFGGAA